MHFRYASIINDYDYSNESEYLSKYLSNLPEKSPVKDILDFVETWGNFNHSDYDESDLVSSEEQKMFDDF